MRALPIVAAALLVASVSAHAAENYCGYGHATAILLVDRTTQFDGTDRSVFLDATADLVTQLGPGDRLVAYTITGAYTESRKLFEQCKPGCPDEGFFAGLMSACSPTVARAELRDFTNTLAADLVTMLRDPEQTPQSDLFRTVAEVTRAYSTNADSGRDRSGTLSSSPTCSRTQPCCPSASCADLPPHGSFRGWSRPVFLRI